MKKLCLFGLAVVFVACNNDKITDVLQISNFFAVRIDPQAVTLVFPAALLAVARTRIVVPTSPFVTA